MKKFIAFFLTILLLLSNFQSTFAFNQNITFPTGKDFEKIKNIIDTKLEYRSWKYNYTAVDEIALKFLITKNFKGNEKFFNELAKQFPHKNFYHYYDNSTTEEKDKTLVEILNTIPTGTKYSLFSGKNRWYTIGDELLESSFGINFEKSDDSLLRNLNSKINTLKWDKYRNLTGKYEYNDAKIPNTFLPSPDELAEETLYRNGEAIKIKNLYGEILYQPSREPRFTADKNQKKVALYLPNTTYTLKRIKDFYTRAEAENFINKTNNSSENSDNLVANSENVFELPCKNQAKSYLERTKCTNLYASLRNIQLGLGAYFADNDKYPENIEKLVWMYLKNIPENWHENFSYKSIKDGDDYEIRFIGKIKTTNQNSENNLKKDYKALLWNTPVGIIPEIFAHIPHDAMALYVKNPKDFAHIFADKSGILSKISSINSVQDFLSSVFAVENLDEISKKISKEFAIITTNLDITSPDYALIFHKNDKKLFSQKSNLKTREIGDFYVVAKSEKTLEKIGNLGEKNMKNADDFRYVWAKKWQKIQSAFVFVGDEFFAKLLELENFVQHMRKIAEYGKLLDFQSLVFAYEEAFDSIPKNWEEIEKYSQTKIPNDIKNTFKILSDGKVEHKNIGTLSQLKTLSEADFDMNRFTFEELDTYREAVTGYKEIWRENLDPMGIVLNIDKNGIEVDFFMTPIPEFQNIELNKISLAANFIAKEKLEFFANPKIRNGIFSIAIGYGFDKITTMPGGDKIMKEAMTERFGTILGIDNILDYINGEFAFSFGGIDEKIFEKYNSTNIEKQIDNIFQNIDVYTSIGFKSKGKWQELIKILQESNKNNNKEENLDWNNIYSRHYENQSEKITKILKNLQNEKYNGNTIYYTNNVLPFIGEFEVAYTFVENFLMIAPNRSTIKKIIDASKNPQEKQEIIREDTFEKNTLVGTAVNGKKLYENIRKIATNWKQSNKKEFYNFLIENLLNLNGFDDNKLKPLLSQYYTENWWNKKLFGKETNFEFEIGKVKIIGKWGEVFLNANKNDIENARIKINEVIKEVDSGNEISKEDFEWIEKMLTNTTKIDDFPNIMFLSLVILPLLEDEELGKDFFKNMTFGLNLGDDEIGFQAKIFTKHSKKLFSFSGGNSPIYLLLGFVIFVIIFGAFGVFIQKKRNKNEEILTTNETEKIPQ